MLSTREEIEQPDEYWSISTWLDLEQAEAISRKFKWRLGRFVAEINIPHRARPQIWRSGPEEGHYSLKAKPQSIRKWVGRVIRFAYP